MDSSLKDLGDLWQEKRPEYSLFAKQVKEELYRLALQNGIRCEASWRTKELDSLLKKQLRYSFSNPWVDIEDKAGVRLIAPYLESLETICALLQDPEHSQGLSFSVQKIDRKMDSMEHDRVGYLGIHIHVLGNKESGFPDMICEVQLHTGAQHLWSAASHDMLYKSSQNVPVNVKRSFYHLVVLMELFDKEVSEAREAIMSLPGHDTYKILNQLEKFYYPLVAREFDQDLSIMVIDGLKRLYTEADLADFGTLMGQFVENRKAKLHRIYSKYSNDHRHLMLFQPEALIVFERSERSKMRLEAAWEEVLPNELLEPLTTIWSR